MVQIKANGQTVDLEKETTLEELLVELRVATPMYVTVQLNEELVEQEAFGTTLVRDGDEVEFLYFMGGGAE